MKWEFEKDGLYDTHILKLEKAIVKIIKCPFSNTYMGLILQKLNNGKIKMMPLIKNGCQNFSNFNHIKSLLLKEYKSI